jgi:aminoglycoside phosphotransferase (APT) family kinase protein
MDGLGSRFERFLAFAEPGRDGRVVACEAITGGYSRMTARARVRWDGGSEQSFILRGDPPPGHGVFTSDRDAEWELLAALPGATSVSTPVARWYDGSGQYLGSKAIVMDCAAAGSLQDEMARAGSGTGVLTDLFVDTFAAVHRTPLDRLPARMPRPPDGSAYLDGVLTDYDRMAQRYPGSAPVLRYISWWARAHKPPPVPLGLVHGDCQPSNVLVGPAGPPMVIDWEFAHIGDPREDLGYYTQIPLQPNVYWADPERFLRRYRAATGLTQEQVNPHVVDYFLMIGMANLLGQLLAAAAAIGASTPAGSADRSGILAPFLINAISHQHDMFLAICDRLS